MNKNLLMLLFIIFPVLLYSQEKIKFKNNLIAYSIKSEKICFNNENNKVFILINDPICTNCLNYSKNLVEKLTSNFNNEIKIFIVLHGSKNNLLFNKNTMIRFSNIFKDVNDYLFDFEDNKKTILRVSKYKQSDFPIFIIMPKKSDYLWTGSYQLFDYDKLIRLFNLN